MYPFLVNAKNELTNALGNTFTYDSNGNLTAETGKRQFSYDAENQLASVNYTGGYWKYEFKYDGRGRMRQQIVYSWNGSNYVWSAETRYVYDGMRVIQERNGSSVPTVSYTRGNDLSGSLEGAGGIGGLLARSDQYVSGSMTRHACYFADGNGNAVNLIDASSAHTVWATYRYNPYGVTTSSSGTLASANVYRFSSKEFLSNPAIYYYGYRWYEPNLQRWMNRDPIAETGGINLYAFVRNSPVHHIDRFGFDLAPPMGPYSPIGMPIYTPPAKEKDGVVNLPPFKHYDPFAGFVEGLSLEDCLLRAEERRADRGIQISIRTRKKLLSPSSTLGGALCGFGHRASLVGDLVHAIHFWYYVGDSQEWNEESRRVYDIQCLLCHAIWDPKLR